MKKELKQLLIICVILIIGCIFGYYFAVSQAKQFNDPEFIVFLDGYNMSIPKPIEMRVSVLLFGWLFSGIASGIIIYSNVAKKWLTPAAPKIIIGIITFPFYVGAGIIGLIPFVIYMVILMFRKNAGQGYI